MSIEISLGAELEKRRRKHKGITLTAPALWSEWLPALFPESFYAPFADRHAELWEWIESIELGVRPRPFLALWGRGGAKSMNCEGGVIRLGAKKVRKYAWYVSGTQEKADQHVDTIGAMLEKSNTGKYYPDLSDRALNKYGSSKGWRRSRLRTASGYTVDALGLDTGSRGSKIEENRPDLIVIDDVDDLFDSTQTTLKKIEILSKTILPAGSNDCAVVFVQNLITSESVASRLLDGRAEFINDKIISGPFPAIEDFEYEQREDGLYYITGGVATWEGQSLDVCQNQIWTYGISSFLQESQHDVEQGGGIWKHVDFMLVDREELPDFVRTAVWVDPAVSSKEQSDSMGISAGGVDARFNVYGLYWKEFITTPEDALETAIMKAIEFKSLTVGVETDQGGDTWRSVFNAALETVKNKLKAKMGRDEYAAISWPRFTSEKAGGTDEKTGKAFGSKVERNSKMLTDYETGKVRHLRGTHQMIHKALKRFPKTPLDLADSWFWVWHDLTRDKPLDWLDGDGRKPLGKTGVRSKWTDE